MLRICCDRRDLLAKNVLHEMFNERGVEQQMFSTCVTCCPGKCSCTQVTSGDLLTRDVQLARYAPATREVQLAGHFLRLFLLLSDCFCPSIFMSDSSCVRPFGNRWFPIVSAAVDGPITTMLQFHTHPIVPRTWRPHGNGLTTVMPSPGLWLVNGFELLSLPSLASDWLIGFWSSSLPFPGLWLVEGFPS